MRGINGSKLLPWILLMLSTVVLAVLGVKHKELRESFLEHRRADMRMQSRQYLPAFKGAAVSGESVTVGEGSPGNRQVLIFLTSTCPFCRRTLPTWKRMALQLSSLHKSDSAVRVVALTTDSMRVAKEYARLNQLSFPLVPFPSTNLVSMYRAFLVPQTLVVDNEGRVLFARHGVINTKQAFDSVLAATSAPDLRDTTKRPARVSSGNIETVSGHATRGARE